MIQLGKLVQITDQRQPDLMSPSPVIPPLAPGFQVQGLLGGGTDLPAAQIAGEEGLQGAGSGGTEGSVSPPRPI